MKTEEDDHQMVLESRLFCHHSDLFIALLPTSLLSLSHAPSLDLDCDCMKRVILDTADIQWLKSTLTKQALYDFCKVQRGNLRSSEKTLLFIFCSHVEQHSFKSICSISPQCKNKNHLIGLTAHVGLYYNLLFQSGYISNLNLVPEWHHQHQSLKAYCNWLHIYLS